MRQYSARWFATPELVDWKKLVAAGEYDGPFFSYPDKFFDVGNRKLEINLQRYLGMTSDQLVNGCTYCGGGLKSIPCPHGKHGCIVHHGFVCVLCGRDDPRQFKYASNVIQINGREVYLRDLESAYRTAMLGGDKP